MQAVYKTNRLLRNYGKALDAACKSISMIGDN